MLEKWNFDCVAPIPKEGGHPHNYNWVLGVNNPAPFWVPFALPGDPFGTNSSKNGTIIFGFVQNDL